MNKIVARYIIKSKESNAKDNYLWYALGSIFFALSSLVMTIAVSRTVGEQIGGMFSIGLSLSQIFMTVVGYEVRIYQVTDVKKEFSFEQYFTFRVLMCVLGVVAAVGYPLINNYSPLKLKIVFLMCVYKIIEAFADVFEGEFQKENRIDIVGKSMLFRTVFSVTGLIVSLAISRNVVLSLIIMIVVEILCVILLNLMPVTVFSKVRFIVDMKSIIKLLMICGPLALSSFVNTYILNCSKLAIDNTMSDEYQLYYSAVFMPNMVINLFSGIIFKPMQVSMAVSYDRKQYKEFSNVIFKMIGIISAFTLLCVMGAYLLGIPVLSFMYGVELKPYKNVLLLLLVAGGINAINVILYYVLTIIRKQNLIAIIYLIVAGVSLLFVEKVTRIHGLTGAAVSYMVLVAMVMVLFALCILYYVKDWRKEK